MAIKELFYDNRPQVLLDPRASNRLDPRFTFTRASAGTYIDAGGVMRTAGENQPRFDHDYTTGEPKGLLLEPLTSNGIPVFWPSGYNNANLNYSELEFNTTDVVAPDGTFTATKIVNVTGDRFANGGPSDSQTWTMSIWARCGDGQTGGFSMRIFGGPISPVFQATDQWQRFTWTRYADTNSGGSRRYPFRGATSTITWYVWGAQYELNPVATSNILSGGSRSADLLSVNAPLPSSGSVYIDARALFVEEDGALLSLKNSSNDKIDLAYLSSDDTYNSLALIASYDGNSKTSLPLPVPTTDRERNIITWGAQNYQYGRDSSRFATSLSSSVPTGLNQLSIGHDAVDPTKAFNGYINTVYAWSGELTPAVAEALVRNEIDAINADTYSPTGPAGSLALVINTQGTAVDGDKTFTLPAESTADDNDIVITWGDGTESGLDGSDAELGASGLTHTYPAAGIYPVWVEGQMENIRFNNTASALDVLEIAAWGTGDMFTSPSTMNSAFYGCTQMDFSSSARTTNRPDTSAVTNWYRAFRDCESITGTFPAFNFSAATTFQEAWQGCSSMTGFVAASNQTQNVTNFASAWYNCNSLTAFPQINTSSGTNFSSAWRNCSSLTTFPLINTPAGTNFSSAWRDCSSLTSFPLINPAAGTNFSSAWYNCSGLTSFPLINTAAGTNFSSAWQGCTSLTGFPLINTAAGTNFDSTWQGCTSLTGFPGINTAAGTNFSAAWSGCSSLTDFPQITTSNGENFNSAWANCSSLASFPQLDTSEGTNFAEAWNGCSSLNNIGVVAGATTSFPLIDTSKGTTFSSAWRGCSSLTTFPSISTALGATFRQAWQNCSSLTDFPASFFDSWTGTPSNGCFYETWDGCSSLTPASVVNILNSIAVSGQSAPSGTGTGNKEITIDWDGTGDPATDAAAAITTLKSLNWQIRLNGVLQ